MINEQIRDREVRVIGEDGEQLGIMSSKEAQQLADDAVTRVILLLDVVEVRGGERKEGNLRC